MSIEPPAKKPKPQTEEMKISWSLKPVLAPELTREPILEKALVGVLRDKRGISKAIAGLAGWLPCSQHLKRCTGLRIYLGPLGTSKPQDMKDRLSQAGFDLSLLEDELEIVEVPAEPARTRAQMSLASVHWPLNFHPDPRLEAVISGSALQQTELEALEACARLLIASSPYAIGNLECNGAALILDPCSGRIVALAAASVDRHPMWHAVMLAVDLVAKHQGGGAWPLIGPTDLPSGEKRKSQLELPLRYPEALYELDHPVPKFGALTREEEAKKEEEAYLCTGYWAVMLQEPCPLCAMVLLHSRVSRIFYGAANQRTGVLGSKAILHSVPGLNHRYHVWSGVLEDECTRTLKKCSVV